MRSNLERPESVSESQFSISDTDSQLDFGLGFDWAIMTHEMLWSESFYCTTGCQCMTVVLMVGLTPDPISNLLQLLRGCPKKIVLKLHLFLSTLWRISLLSHIAFCILILLFGLHDAVIQDYCNKSTSNSFCAKTGNVYCVFHKRNKDCIFSRLPLPCNPHYASLLYW